jgi:predicted  nucleic acid-binding Zn-ribbon protein
VEQATERRAQLDQIIRSLVAERDRLRAEVQQAEGAQKEVRAQLARLTDDLAARTGELAKIDGQVQAARSELADTQARLAEARQQLSQPSVTQPAEALGRQ